MWSGTRFRFPGVLNSECPGLSSRLRTFMHGVTYALSLWCVLYSLFPGLDVVSKVSVAVVDLVS